MDILIRPMRPGDLDQVCEVLGLAFADNPNALAIVGDRAKAERMMRSGARIGKVGRPVSWVLVAERAGRVAGVLNAARWPHCQLSVREKLAMAPAMIAMLGSALPRAARSMRVMAKHDPAQDHWHLGPIGVHPDQQGGGIGSALLTTCLAAVDEQRLPAHLETDVDRNVVLYARFGFETVARADINGVRNTFMWRARSLT